MKNQNQSISLLESNVELPVITTNNIANKVDKKVGVQLSEREKYMHDLLTLRNQHVSSDKRIAVEKEIRAYVNKRKRLDMQKWDTLLNNFMSNNHINLLERKKKLEKELDNLNKVLYLHNKKAKYVRK